MQKSYRLRDEREDDASDGHKREGLPPAESALCPLRPVRPEAPANPRRPAPDTGLCECGALRRIRVVTRKSALSSRSAGTRGLYFLQIITGRKGKSDEGKT